jgi:DNA-3-methyladenine glycosylase II
MIKIIKRNDIELKALESLDSKLKILFDHVGNCEIKINHPHFPFLVYTIIGQQVSLKVADMLYERVQNAFEITPSNILSKPADFYRELGLSYRKAEYLHHLAHFFKETSRDGYQLNTESKEKVYDALIQVKGIGSWSVDMFIMFCMSDMDHFSKKDIGLINAYNQCFNLNKTPDEIEKDALKWRPYRSVVAHYLWHYNDH